MEIRQKKTKAAQVVYIQFRQATRGKDGKLAITLTRTRSVSNATIDKIEAICMKAIEAA